MSVINKKNAMPYEIYILDLIGTFAFAIYGSYFAIEKEFDLFGILVCAFLTAFGGGTLRDIILNTQPFYFFDVTYIVVVIVAVAFTILINKNFIKIHKLVRVADSIGLVTFAFIGASKASASGLGIVAIVILATITAVGWWIIRDMIMSKIPEIMYRDFYATIAVLLGVIYSFTAVYMQDIVRANILIISFLIVRITAEFFAVNLRKPKK